MSLMRAKNFSAGIYLKVALTGLFHPECLAHAVSWFAFVVAIFVANNEII